MGIKANFSMGDIQQRNQQFVDGILIAIEEVLQRSIIEVVKIAKNKAAGGKYYTDRTNNLRSSIGYVLYKDGQKVSASFEKAGDGGDGNGAVGAQKGLAYADSVANSFSSGYVVVMVAGMDYAAYVEAKGFDVITGASLDLDPIIKRNFEDAKNAIKEQTGIDLSLI